MKRRPYRTIAALSIAVHALIGSPLFGLQHKPIKAEAADDPAVSTATSLDNATSTSLTTVTAAPDPAVEAAQVDDSTTTTVDTSTDPSVTSSSVTTTTLGPGVTTTTAAPTTTTGPKVTTTTKRPSTTTTTKKGSAAPTPVTNSSTTQTFLVTTTTAPLVPPAEVTTTTAAANPTVSTAAPRTAQAPAAGQPVTSSSPTSRPPTSQRPASTTTTGEPKLDAEVNPPADGPAVAADGPYQAPEGFTPDKTPQPAAEPEFKLPDFSSSAPLASNDRGFHLPDLKLLLGSVAALPLALLALNGLTHRGRRRKSERRRPVQPPRPELTSMPDLDEDEDLDELAFSEAGDEMAVDLTVTGLMAAPPEPMAPEVIAPEVIAPEPIAVEPDPPERPEPVATEPERSRLFLPPLLSPEPLPAVAEATSEPAQALTSEPASDVASREVIPVTPERPTTERLMAQMAAQAPPVVERGYPIATPAVPDEMAAWASRPLDQVYPVLFIDAITVKVSNEPVKNRSFYYAVGITTEGERDCLGMWPSTGADGTDFWFGALAGLRRRGVADVCIVVCDGLTGLAEAAGSIWPGAAVQTGVLRLLRNTFRLASPADSYAIAFDLEAVYTAATATEGEQALVRFCAVWGQRYPAIQNLWFHSWDAFVTLLVYSPDIRRVICSTQTLESIHSRFRLATPDDGHFPDSPAAMSALYRVASRLDPTGKGENRWVEQWNPALNALSITFGDRIFPNG